jgi:hypothetical protein
MRVANHCLRYLYAIKYLDIKCSVSRKEEMMIIIEKNNFIYINEQMFKIIVNVSFANYSNRKSDEDYIFKLFDEMIDWAIRKQLTMITSTTETELLAMLHAEKKLIWLMHLFEKLSFDFNQEITIYNDNLQIIRILTSKIARTNIKLRHIDII